MIRNFSIIASIVLLAAMATSAPALTEAELKENAFYQLYLARLDMTKAAMERHAAQRRFYEARKAMIEKLFRARASSLEEYLAASSQFVMSSSAFMEAAPLVREAEALLSLTKVRVTNGQEMPICSTLRHTSEPALIPGTGPGNGGPITQ